MEDEMKIGILGTGDVGKTLSKGFVELGHEVKIGSRKASDSAVTFAEAAKFGDIVVLAVLWSGAENVVRLAGQENLAGKVVIDATNPLIFPPNAPPELAIGHKDSAGQQVQRWLPSARVVKAFNIVGHAHMFKPQFPGGPPDMFICGNDAAAKQTVTEILKEFGWPAIDIGGIEGSRLLEPLCLLWVRYGIRTGTFNHAFKLLRR